jgi:hypothetical protein
VENIHHGMTDVDFSDYHGETMLVQDKPAHGGLSLPAY